MYWSFSLTHANGEWSRYRRFWPFCSIETKSDGSLRVRALDIWPQRFAEPVDRNWSPLWTVFSRYREAQRERVDVLWGMYQFVRDHNVCRRSLFPFFEYSRDLVSGQKKLSLFLGLWSYSPASGTDKDHSVP